MGCIFGNKKKNTVAAPVVNEVPKTEIIAEDPKPVAKTAQAPKAENKQSAPEAEVKAAPKADTKAAPKAEAKATPKADTKVAPKNTTQKATATKESDEPKKSVPVGKFAIKKAKDDRFVFNLYAANQVIVATSQVYSSSTAAMNGIKSVIENAGKAPVEDQTLKSYETLPYPKWEIYQDKGGQYRFRLNASNGSCICHSQGYTTKASCKNGIESIIRTSKNAEIDKSYLKKD